MFYLVSRPIGDLEASLKQEVKKLDAIRPYTWINIPAPVRDAFAVNMTISNSILNNMVTISNNFKIFDRETRRREQRYRENMDSIMKVIKDKVDSLREQTEKNLNNVNN